MNILLGSWYNPKTLSSFLEDLLFEFLKEHGTTIFFLMSHVLYLLNIYPLNIYKFSNLWFYSLLKLFL